MQICGATAIGWDAPDQTTHKNITTHPRINVNTWWDSGFETIPMPRIESYMESLANWEIPLSAQMRSDGNRLVYEQCAGSTRAENFKPSDLHVNGQRWCGQEFERGSTGTVESTITVRSTKINAWWCTQQTNTTSAFRASRWFWHWITWRKRWGLSKKGAMPYYKVRKWVLGPF